MDPRFKNAGPFFWTELKIEGGGTTIDNKNPPHFVIYPNKFFVTLIFSFSLFKIKDKIGGKFLSKKNRGENFHSARYFPDNRIILKKEKAYGNVWWLPV